MGKSKKRLIYKGKTDSFTSLSRSDAIKKIIDLLKIRDKEAYSLITLFGVTAEELLEAGTSYELVKGMENILE